jgi:hypothetical protein
MRMKQKEMHNNLRSKATKCINILIESQMIWPCHKKNTSSNREHSYNTCGQKDKNSYIY